jgi:hypothetical protein
MQNKEYKKADHRAPDTSVQFSRKRKEIGGQQKISAALSEKSLGDRCTPPPVVECLRAGIIGETTESKCANVSRRGGRITTHRTPGTSIHSETLHDLLQFG